MNSGASLRRFLFLLIVFVAAPLAVASEFGDPRGFFGNETVVEKTLHAGVRWYEVKGTDGGQPQIVHVVKADISQPHLTLKALAGNRLVGGAQFFRRSTVSQLHADNDAFVTINTAFFDIRDTMAPRGLLLQDKKMLREPQIGGNTLVFDAGGKPYVTSGLRSINRVHYKGQSRSFPGINANTMSASALGVYLQPWERSPGTTAGFMSGRAVTEVVVADTTFLPTTAGEPSRIRGRISHKRENQPSVTIGSSNFVITATGAARPFLQGMQIGDTVEVEWTLTNPPEGVSWNSITQGLGGGGLLLDNGVVQSIDSTHWNARHPRSSIGVNEDRTQIVLVLVEGRQGNAAGLSLHQLARFHKHMGAKEALEFDGGGSSSIVARVDGMNQRLNRPSDGSERYVPAGLGLMLVEEQPISLFQNIRVAADEGEAVISWQTVAPSISYARFGEFELDRRSSRTPNERRRHTAYLTGLKSGETYYARLVAERGGQTYQTPLIAISHSKLNEIIVDDEDAVFTGSPAWTSGAYSVPWGDAYRWIDTVTGNPTHTATFRPDLPATGLYDVFIWYTSGTNRPVDASYEIHHRYGTQTVSVNQTTNGAQWNLLAQNRPFTRGNSHFVRINNKSGTAGRAVIADAVRWVLKEREAGSGEIPSWWMTHFFGDDWPEFSTDFDGDGGSIQDEFIWGTDPTDPNSRLRVELGEEEGVRSLTFSPFHEGRIYRLLRSSDLDADSWEIVSGVEPVRLESGEGRFLLPTSLQSKQFYRIEIER